MQLVTSPSMSVALKGVHIFLVQLSMQRKMFKSLWAFKVVRPCPIPIVCGASYPPLMSSAGGKCFWRNQWSFFCLSSCQHSPFFSNCYHVLISSRTCKLSRMETHQRKLLVCGMLWYFPSAKGTSSKMPGQLSPRKLSTASRDSKRELMCSFTTEIDSQR